MTSIVISVLAMCATDKSIYVYKRARATISTSSELDFNTTRTLTVFTRFSSVKEEE